MADVKLSALALIAAASISATDSLAMTDMDPGTPVTYRTNVAQLRTAILQASVGSGWGATDYLGLGSGTVPSSGMIRVGQGTITTSAPLINSTVTWNDAAVTFTHLFVGITSTASAAASLIADWQVGGSSMWKVTKAGAVTQAAGLTVSSGGITVTTGGLTVTGNSTITGTLGGVSTLTATTVVAALTGNASTATALQTARTINGVSFDGTANIIVSAGTTGTLTFGTYLQASSTSFAGSDATIATNATSANTASTLVARDGSGNFSAGTITANVTGNLTGTVLTATQNSVTTMTGLVTVGALNSGSITSGFGSIDIGSDTITSGAINSQTISSTASFTGTITFADRLIATGTGLLFSRTAASTALAYFDIANTGARIQFGIEGSGGGQIISASPAYASVITSVGATDLYFGVNSAIAAYFTATTFTVSRTTTAVQALTATTVTTSGTLAVSIAGLTSPVKIGAHASDGTYGFLSFNNSFTPTTAIGMAAGGSGDSNLYRYVPTGGKHSWRVNDVEVMSANSTTIAVLALTATTGAFSALLTANLGLNVNGADLTMGAGRNINIVAGQKFYFDAGVGNNFLTESSTNVVDLTVGGAIAWQASTTYFLLNSGLDLIVAATKKLRLDGSGAGDCYISESSANVITLTASAGVVCSAGLSATTGAFSSTITTTGAKTGSGSTGVNFTVTNLFAATTPGVYLVYAYNVAGSMYSLAIMSHDGTTGRTTQIHNSADETFFWDGANVQLSQNSGTNPTTFTWSYLRIG